MKILQINSSIRGGLSASNRLASAVVARLQSLNPGAETTVRDLSKHPFLDAEALQALGTPADQRTPAQAARVAVDDQAIAEVQAADVLVLGVPLYNLAEPVQLKAWIDSITRAGTTFRYTAEGPEGLLKGKKAYVVFARGGLYRDTAFDTQTPYLRNLLGFLGIVDVTFLHAEGLAMGEAPAREAIERVESEIRSLAA